MLFIKEFISMRFFKLVMILLLKIYATEIFFKKIICLKTIGDIFFSNMWSGISGETRRLKFLVGGDIHQKGKLQTYGIAGRTRPPSHLVPPIPSLSETSWSPHNENPEEGAWPTYCNDFEKNEWECLLSKQQIYSM